MPEATKPTAGDAATAAEALSARGSLASEDESLRRSPASREPLPQRRARRRRTARRGDRIALRRALRLAVRNDGELMELPGLRRRTAQRPMLLLIDVSGSMKSRPTACGSHTAGTRAAADRGLHARHAAHPDHARAPPQTGDEALAVASGIVADWDGGTGSAMRCRSSSRCRALPASRAAPSR